MISSLWVDKYCPKSIKDYIFSDPIQKLQIEKWIEEQDVPHILAVGTPGIGKSAIFHVLIHELNIHPYDVLWINASVDRNIDTMREKITSFAGTIPFGKTKIIVLDEADGLNQLTAQPALRGIMEMYSATCRFFLSCNYGNKILPAIHSRCQTLNITKLDIVDFTVKSAEILIAENIDFDPDDLDIFVNGTFPDMRKMINNLQLNSVGGKLLKPSNISSGSVDYRIEAIELFKSKKIREARTLICSQIRPEEIEDFFRFLYDHIDLFGSTDEAKDSAILIIRKGLCQIPLCADVEILIAAVLIELAQIGA